jgi:hypothetical protein
LNFFSYNLFPPVLLFTLIVFKKTRKAKFQTRICLLATLSSAATVTVRPRAACRRPGRTAAWQGTVAVTLSRAGLPASDSVTVSQRSVSVTALSDY